MFTVFGREGHAKKVIFEILFLKYTHEHFSFYIAYRLIDFKMFEGRKPK